MDHTKQLWLHLALSIASSIECTVAPCCLTYTDSFDTTPSGALSTTTAALPSQIGDHLHKIAQSMPKLFSKYSIIYEHYITDSIYLSHIIANNWNRWITAYIRAYPAYAMYLYQINQSLEAIITVIMTSDPDCLCNFESDFSQLIIILDTIVYTLHTPSNNHSEETLPYLTEQFNTLAHLFDMLDR